MKEILVTLLIFLIITIATLFAIDNYRMSHNKPVIFSTWGRKYTPPEEEKEEKTEVEEKANKNKDSEIKGIIVVEAETDKLTHITTDEIGDMYDYDIFYYGLETVSVELADKTMILRKALLADIITMEAIIAKAEKDVEKGLIEHDIYKDGGSKIYKYETYTIIKKNTLEGNKDVYIGIPAMILSGDSVAGF